jgi:LysR family hydrogen peroxide-inducible transcriptional activator
MLRPTLRQLDYLIALKKSGSFNAAAQMMHVTQSTLSAGIKELEAILGQPVAVRSKRSVTLTPFGETIAAKGLQILQQTDQLMSEAKAMDEPLSGVLRLGIIPTIAPYILPAILPKLQTQFPKLRLQIFEDLSERIVQQAQNGQVDAIILAFPYPTPGLKQTPLWQEDFVLATTTPSKIKSVTLDDLKDQKLLLLEDGHCLRDHALQACQLPAPQAHKTFNATSLPTLIQMVASGYGATLLPAMVAQSNLPDGVMTVPFKAPKPKRTIGMAWNNKRFKVSDLELLAENIKNIYKSKP